MTWWGLECRKCNGQIYVVDWTRRSIIVVGSSGYCSIHCDVDLWLNGDAGSVLLANWSSLQKRRIVIRDYAQINCATKIVHLFVVGNWKTTSATSKARTLKMETTFTEEILLTYRSGVPWLTNRDTQLPYKWSWSILPHMALYAQKALSGRHENEAVLTAPLSSVEYEQELE